MKTTIALAVMATAVATAYAAGPFDAFKGRIKEGMYEYTMEMDMGQVPGMPKGMPPQKHSFQHCVTQKDIDQGELGKGKNGPQQNCEIKNMNMSGNTATYTMECKGEPSMKADNRITFVSDGFDMDMKMQMTRQGQAMNMSQKMSGRYKGPCK